MLSDWRQLAVTTVTDPASAARSLMGLQIPREALWTGLALVAVLNTILFSLSNILVPPAPGQPLIFNMPPVLYFGMVIGGLAMTVYAIYWTGRLLGGRGSLADVMVLVVWLQCLRVAVQVAVLVLVLTVPLLSAMIVFAAAIVGLYILVHFIDQAHRLGSLGRAAGVLVASILAIVVGLSVLVSLVGGPIVGSSIYV